MHVCRLQDIQFDRKEADCVCMNWGLCYLSEEDMLVFLKKVKDVLMHKTGKNGLLICKETTRDENDTFTFDPKQCMHIRTKDWYVK